MAYTIADHIKPENIKYKDVYDVSGLNAVPEDITNSEKKEELAALRSRYSGNTFSRDWAEAISPYPRYNRPGRHYIFSFPGDEENLPSEVYMTFRLLEDEGNIDPADLRDSIIMKLSLCLEDGSKMDWDGSHAVDWLDVFGEKDLSELDEAEIYEGLVGAISSVAQDLETKRQAAQRYWNGVQAQSENNIDID